MSAIQQVLASFGARDFVLVTSNAVADATAPLNITIPVHSGQAGDVVILAWAAGQNGSAPTDSTPAGYTKVTTQSLVPAYGYRTSVFYKVATASTSGEVIQINAAVEEIYLVAVVRRNSSPISTVTVNNLNQQAVAASPTNQTIAISSSPTFPALGVAFLAQYSAGLTNASTGRSVSRLSTQVSVDSTDLHLWLDGSPNADITVSEGDGGAANFMQTFYLTFT